MAATQAKGGFGTKFYRDDGTGTFVAIAEVGDISGPERSQILEDATHMESPSGWAEKIAVGVKEGGDITFQAAFLQDDASQAALRSDVGSTTKRNYRIVFPSGNKRLSFAGFVQRIGATYPVKGKMVTDFTISVTGPITEEAHP